MQIQPGPVTVESLFSQFSHLEVPTFQRGYAWKIDNLDQFLDDIKSTAESSGPHFFGPLVLLREQGETTLGIVDGQQRISTVVMCIALLRDIVAEFDTPTVYKGTMKEKNLAVECHEALFTDSGDARFRAAPAIRAVFKDRIIADSSADRKKMTPLGRDMPARDRRNSRELRAAWIHLDGELRTYVRIIDDVENQKERIHALLKALTASFSIYTMILSSEQDAYLLFETLNDRGLRLSPGDILKTMTLRKISSSGTESDLEDALARWDLIMDNLDEFDVSRFLRHYLLATSSKPVKRTDVLNVFRQRIKELDDQGSDGAQLNLARLYDASTHYSPLIGVGESEQVSLDECARRLNVLGDTHRVFMLGARLRGSFLASDDMLRLFRAAEYLHFRWTLAGLNAQQLEKKYQDLLDKLEESRSATDVIQETINTAPGDLEFSGAKPEAKLLNGNADHVRYLLHRLEIRHGANVPFWGRKSSLTLEHLAPQKPGKNSNWFKNVAPAESTSGQIYDEYKDRWGNLTMLEWRLNVAVKNAEWNVKLNGAKHGDRCLKTSTYSVNAPLADVTAWTATIINHRTEWLQKSMLLLLGTEWVHSGVVAVPNWVPPSQGSH
jgi:hypothetical protein